MVGRILTLVLASASVISLAAAPSAQAQDTWHVDDDAPPGGDGTSWASAFRFLRDGLVAARTADTVLVAGGTYPPDRSEAYPDGTGYRGTSFWFVNGAAIYGGYAGLADPNNPDTRDIVQYESILSGDLNGDDGPDFTNYDENSYHVLATMPWDPIDETAALDGFTISGGHADDYSGIYIDDGIGAGIYLEQSSPSISHCRIERNLATASINDQGGGGIFCGEGSNPTLTNCIIVDNATDDFGAGIFCDNSHPVLTDCSIVRNQIIWYDGSGGGAYCTEGSAPVFTDCLFAENYGRESGGGLVCRASSPTITDCTFTSNTARNSGGAIYLEQSAPAINNTCFNRNRTTRQQYRYGGGAIYCDGSNPTLSGCTFKENSARLTGGAIANVASSPTVTDCRFDGNWAAGTDDYAGSGALDNSEGSCPTFLRCTFERNAGNVGGAVGNWGESHATFTACTFIANSASWPSWLVGGGAMANVTSDPTLTNCVFVNNWSMGAGGGAMLIRGASPTLTNCTFTGNRAIVYGGAILAEGGPASSNPTIANCVLWSNSAGLGSELAIFDTVVNLTVGYSNVAGGAEGVYVRDAALTWEDGNTDADPLLALAGDAHPMPGSPCIDAGTNEPPAGLPAEDADGSSRALDGDGDGTAVADMGAYEFVADATSLALWPISLEAVAPLEDPPPIEHVLSLRGTGELALQWTVTEDCPWVEVEPTSGVSSGEIDEITVTIDAAGLPRGDHACELTTSSPQAANSPRVVPVTLRVYRTLRVPSEHATIQGGIDAAEFDGDVVEVADGIYTGPGNKDLDFAGRIITVRSASGPEHCTIDCEGTGRAFHFHSGEPHAATVEGFTITNGNVDDGGGAVLCEYSSVPTLMSCRLVGNAAAIDGGAVHCGYGAGATLLACTLSDNSARNGGGLCGYDRGVLIVSDCTFRENSADGYGGGLYCDDAAITDSTFTANVAASSGGGVYGGYESLVGIERSTFNENHADSGGGLASREKLALTNCVVTGNTATSGGGGAELYYVEGGIRNTTVADNTASYGGGFFTAECELILDGCTISGNSAEYDGGAGVFLSGELAVNATAVTGNAGNRDGGGFWSQALTTITNSIVSDNVAGSNGGGIYLEWPELHAISTVFARNSTDRGGAGVESWGRSMFSNCTFTENVSVSSGVALKLYGGEVRNCILWGDLGASSREMFVANSPSSWVTLSYNDIEGGRDAVYVQYPSAFTWGDGNFDADPWFIDPNSLDYTLAPGSPCIDAGENDALPTGVISDLAGNPRFVDDPGMPDAGSGTPPIVDLGAFEHQGTTCFGDLDGDGAIGLEDLANLLAHYRLTGDVVYTDGDLDRDGDVDLSDLAALLPHFGTTCE